MGSNGELVNIYLAGPYSSRLELLEIVKRLEQYGHSIKVPAIWLSGVHDDACPVECALTDIVNIKNSEMLLLFTNQNGRNGGRYIELGIAMGLEIPCIIVGDYTNVFTRLHRRIDSVDEFLFERTLWK